MVRVALLVHEMPSPEHPYITDWVHALIRAGVDITIFAEVVSRGSSASAREKNELGTLLPHVRQLNSVDKVSEAMSTLVRNRNSVIRSLASPGEIKRLFRIVRTTEKKRTTVLRKAYEYLPVARHRFDLVHFNAAPLAIRRFELGKIMGIRTLVSFRGQDITFYPERYRKVLTDADHVHFIADHQITEAAKCGYSDGKHTVIHPMVDTSFYTPPDKCRPLKGAADRLTLFTAARLFWTKGWEFALQATSILIGRGWNIDYYIAGDGDFRDAVLHTIRQLQLNDRVHLLGWCSPEVTRDWLQKADLYVLASVEEAFNNSVLQAQACGLPVVCSDAGGLPENIQDGVTGLLARRRDAWDLADKMERLLSDSQCRQLMSSAARERAERFSLEGNVAAFVDLYERLGSEASPNSVSSTVPKDR